MKTVKFITIMMLVFIAGCVPPEMIAGDELVHSEVYEVDKDQDDIYLLANQWMARTFVDSDNAIRFSDREDGQVVGRLSMTPSCSNEFVEASSVEINWDVTARDGRYRLRHDVAGSGNVREDCVEDAVDRLEGFRSSMFNYIEGEEVFE